MTDDSRTPPYPTPERGEDKLDSDLPIGWIAGAVSVPPMWETEFIERGHTLRFRIKVDRDEYGLRPPGWPGVGITSGSDYWCIVADTTRVIRDEWHDPDDDLDDVLATVKSAIQTVEQDLERARLASLLEGCVPSRVVENLIDRFETADRVLEIGDDPEILESVSGIGPARRDAMLKQVTRIHYRNADGDATVEVNRGETA